MREDETKQCWTAQVLVKARGRNVSEILRWRSTPPSFRFGAEEKETNSRWLVVAQEKLWLSATRE